MARNQNAGYGQAEIASIIGNMPTTGKIFVVAASGNANYNLIDEILPPDYAGVQRRYSTVDAAVNACTASAGDVILVAPGHTETFAAASSIALDVVGVTVIGLGSGALRPTFSYSTTDSTIAMNAASCVLKNIIIKPTVDSVVAGIVLSAPSCTIDIESQDTSSAVEFISPIVTTAAADKATINAKHIGFLAGDAMTRYIDVVGMNTGRINVDFYGKASVAVVNFRTTASDNVNVTGYFYNGTTANTLDVVDSVGTSTWTLQGFDGVAGSTITGGSGSSVVGGYDPLLGYRVTKVSNLADGSGTDNLFTVTGRCLITSLTGEVTTVIGGAATMKLRDITNSVDLCAATTIDTDAVGTMYALTSISANILNGTGMTPVVGSIPNMTGASQFNVAVVGNVQGALTIAHVLDAADTGAVTWVLYYKPLTAASTIVAAA